MAGEWIKMRTNLWDDPRVSDMCDLTGQTEATVIGALYWLWSTADEHTEDGFMPGLRVGAIDRKTGVRGIGAAMVAAGWLEESDAGVTILRFTEHNGKSAKTRALGAKRAADHRSNAGSVTDPLQQRDEDVTGALPREEKRREEVNPTITSNEVMVVASDADDQHGAAPIKVMKPSCPHQDIIAIYHEVLPMCPQVRDWTPARQEQLRARWNEDPSRQNLAYWRRYFEYVKTCGFLVGIQPNIQRRPFFADLEWLTKQANFTKVRERKYES